MLNSNHGRTDPVLPVPAGSVMFCSVIIGETRCGRLCKSTRFGRTTFGVTGFVAGALGGRA